MFIKLKDQAAFEKMIIMNGHSKRSFAKEAGLSSPLLIQIAKGNRHASPKSAKKIADALKVKFEDIFFIDEDNKSKQGQKNKSA